MPGAQDPTARPATEPPAGSSRPADLVALDCGDAPGSWAALGFAVDGDEVRVGPVVIRLDGAGGGLRGWTLRGTHGAAEVDGIQMRWRDPPPAAAGAFGLDHVVVVTNSVDRTVDALVAVGGSERRRAEPPGVPAPMAFVRLGAVIVEVVEAGGPTRLWGLTGVAEDLEALPAGLVGTPRDAVQPGRRIVTVARAAGLETAVAFITPRARTRP